MATFFLENFGCRATDADASAIRRALCADGFVFDADPAAADVIVLNTCTVTAAADSQAREAIRKVHRANSSARIVVTGCYAQRAPEELATLEGVACVVGNSHQTEIPAVLRELAVRRADIAVAPGGSQFVSLGQLDSAPMSLVQGPPKILTGDILAQSALAPAADGRAEGDRTRPILKIQDGCNNRCSYCVIPFVRGRSRSLAPGAVIAEALALVAAGAKEIVLSGINLGAYGRDLNPPAKLAAVVRRILQETALEQLRFSSIEPQDITEEFVALVASSPRIAPHFHIPLQSGSDTVLRAMHRWYRAAHYAARVHLIHDALPHASIGADVIVGFPGETDADFQATRALIESLPLAYLHIFSFSERPGTEAERLASRVAPATIRERARTLRALSRQKADEFRVRQQGGRLRALTLARATDAFTEALTGNYLKVRVAGRHAANQWIEVAPTADADAILPAEGPVSAEVPLSASAFENHLGQREIAAVRDC